MNASPAAEFACAVCKRQVRYSGPLPQLYPFCSPRCQSADLGVWLREGYVLTRDLTPEELAAHRPPGDEPV